MSFVQGPLGVTFFTGDICQAQELLIEVGEAPGSTVIHFVNAFTLAVASANPRVMKTLTSDNSLNLVDSFWLARVLTSKLGSRVEQIAGPMLFSSVVENTKGLNLKQFFLGGSSEDVLIRITDKMSSSGSSSLIVGQKSPPFFDIHDFDSDDYAAEILESKADLVWIGLGTPKQDIVAYELAKSLNCTLACVGAAFDFYAGSKKNAPALLRKTGFEWAFRLATEPRRLWRRYVFGNLKFITISVGFLLEKR